MPDAVRGRATQLCTLFSSPGVHFKRDTAYENIDQSPPPYLPVDTTDWQFPDKGMDGREFHIVILGLASDGRVLYRGEDDETVSDGVTFVIVCTPTGTL